MTLQQRHSKLAEIRQRKALGLQRPSIGSQGIPQFRERSKEQFSQDESSANVEVTQVTLGRKESAGRQSEVTLNSDDFARVDFQLNQIKEQLESSRRR